MKITNLEDLRKVVSEDTVKMIVTEYMMETIARSNILSSIENDLKDMDDTDTITATDLKKRISMPADDELGDIIS